MRILARTAHRLTRSTLAIYAARLSLQAKLPLTDSLVYATARASEATLWTQADDFEGRDDVKCSADYTGSP